MNHESDPFAFERSIVGKPASDREIMTLEHAATELVKDVFASVSRLHSYEATDHTGTVSPWVLKIKTEDVQDFLEQPPFVSVRLEHDQRRVPLMSVKFDAKNNQTSLHYDNMHTTTRREAFLALECFVNDSRDRDTDKIAFVQLLQKHIQNPDRWEVGSSNPQEAVHPAKLARTIVAACTTTAQSVQKFTGPQDGERRISVVRTQLLRIDPKTQKQTENGAPLTEIILDYASQKRQLHYSDPEGKPTMRTYWLPTRTDSPMANLNHRKQLDEFRLLLNPIYPRAHDVQDMTNALLQAAANEKYPSSQNSD
jgi:hypothetical protein